MRQLLNIQATVKRNTSGTWASLGTARARLQQLRAQDIALLTDVRGRNVGWQLIIDAATITPQAGDRVTIGSTTYYVVAATPITAGPQNTFMKLELDDSD